MTEISKHTLDIPYYVTAIRTSEEYLEARKEQAGQTETIKRAAGALALHETRGGEYRSREGDVFDVISKIDTFASSQAKLESLKSRNAPRQEKLPYLRDVIEFNHAVKQMVNNNPSLKFDEVVAFVTKMYMLSNQQEIRNLKSQEEREAQLGWFKNTTSVTLNGMRHELGAEQILGTIDDLDYEDISTEDELHGVDYFVTIGDKRCGIDIKAGQHRTAEARTSSRHPERIIWSQLSNQDFGNNFRIPTEVAQSKAAAMRAELEAAMLAVAA